MTDTSDESASSCIRRLGTELAEVQAATDYRNHVPSAERIRREIERIGQVVELPSLRGNQRVTA